MWQYFWGDATPLQLAALCASAILIGINKTGVPGLGMLPVVLLTLTFEPRLSTGLQLLMLAAADVIAVSYYRRKANWKLICRLLPSAFAGLAIGSLTLRLIDDGWLRPIIGTIILLLAAFNFIKNRFIDPEKVPSHWAFAVVVGILAGFTTQVANAAGPVMALYLLAMRLPKTEYMGTCAWLFLILNWTKLPIFISEGRITLNSLRADLPMLPLVVLGGVLGIVFIRKIPQTTFNRIIEILVLLSAIKLLIPA